MKNYYQTLNTDDKNRIKALYEEKYSKSDLGMRLFRLKIYALVSYVFASIILFYSFAFERSKTSSLIISITLLILGTIYFIGSCVIKLKILNKLALENK